MHAPQTKNSTLCCMNATNNNQPIENEYSMSKKKFYFFLKLQNVNKYRFTAQTASNDAPHVYNAAIPILQNQGLQIRDVGWLNQRYY